MRQALEMALEAFEEIAWSNSTDWQRDRAKVAITAIKEALAQLEEEKLHPVHIGVDVTKEGTAVTAFYRRPNSVMEMFYSQFHPLAQPEQEPVAWATREDFYCELDRTVERIRKEMEIKSVTMRCKDYDLALPIIDTHFGRVLVGQVSTPPQRKPLTDADLASVCLTRRHDFGLMSDDERSKLMFQAREWAHAFGIEVTAHGIKEKTV